MLLAAFALSLQSRALAGNPVTLTYPDILDRLVNLEHLALLPLTGERSGQFSSFDRGGGNHDMAGFVRHDPDGAVMADMQGPGCVWVIFSARPRNGHVKIFLDGAPQPAVDLPFIEYFTGTNAPFTGSELVQRLAGGFNNYTPIPYQTSCRIIATGKWGAYYRIGYSTFPPGTRVATFRRDLSQVDKAALERVNEQLKSCGPGWDESRHGEGAASASQRFNASLANGRTATFTLSGPAAIRAFRLKLPDLPGYPDDRRILREWTISIRWDDEETPAVWAPLGDFFGTAAGANTYRSLPMGYTEEGVWYANWVMPFSRKAEVTLCNQGAEKQDVELELVTSPLADELSRYGRFHAKWHRDAPTSGMHGWSILNTSGRGRFVGVMLHVMHSGMWWGEGDEMFWVDGEKTHQGTGSEDFFGYAWANPQLFYNAFHNQTLSEGNQGNVSLNRWFIGDSVPFQSSFAAAIEKMNGQSTKYSCTAYWYLAPGSGPDSAKPATAAATGRPASVAGAGAPGETPEPDSTAPAAGQQADPYGPVELSERLYHWSTNLPARVPGAVELTFSGHLDKTDGKLVPLRSASASNGDIVQWKGLQPGDRVSFPLWAYRPGRYEVGIKLFKGPHYATCRLYLDGKPLGGPVDCYSNDGEDMAPIELGVHELTRGRHTFTIEILGANPATKRVNKEWYLAMDYVKLLRVETRR